MSKIKSALDRLQGAKEYCEEGRAKDALDQIVEAMDDLAAVKAESARLRKALSERVGAIIIAMDRGETSKAKHLLLCALNPQPAKPESVREAAKRHGLALPKENDDEINRMTGVWPQKPGEEAGA